MAPNKEDIAVNPDHARAFLNSQAFADAFQGLVSVQREKVTISYHADGMIVVRDSGTGLSKAWDNRAAFAADTI